MPPRSDYNESSDIPDLQWISSDSYESDSDTKSTQTTSITKSLRFSAHNDIHLIEHLDELSDDDVASMWYNVDEYEAMKVEYKKIVSLMENSNGVIQSNETSRGLEYRTRTGAWARYTNKKCSFRAVLQEQEKQWDKNIRDVNAIANVYMKHSRKCRRAAFLMGRKDAMEANGIHGKINGKSIPLTKSRSESRLLGLITNRLSV